MTGNIGSRDLSLRNGKTVLKDISISSAVKSGPARDRPENNLKLLVLGGGFYGDADLRDSSQLKVSGQLRNFDLQALSTNLAGKQVGDIGGVISGPVSARGNLKAKGATGFTAKRTSRSRPNHAASRSLATSMRTTTVRLPWSH